MKVFVVYNQERVTLDVALLETVGELIEIVRDVFQIGPDEGPAGSDEQEAIKLTLTYAGADLNPKWFLTDLGIQSGVTLRAVLREEIKASLRIFVVFTGETKEILEKINFHTATVADVRGRASKLSGLPVGCFRLLTAQGKEMFDIHILDVYGINLGDTLKLEVWDGWADFLKAAFAGQTNQVMASMSADEVTARYQCKVALYVAAHCGHADLALTLIKTGGVRADEPVGYHPSRQWCQAAVKHIDSEKTPIHESSEAGQLGVLRSFVHLDISNVLARDGNGLTPLNVALRSKQKGCASFLLTKQWSKVPYAKKASLPLSIFVKMKKWCERSRERTFVIYGQWKSSMKRKFIQEGLVGYGVQLDGFSKSALNSQPATDDPLRRKKSLRASNEDVTTVTPEAYFKLLNRNTGLPKVAKIMMNIAQSDGDNDDDKTSNSSDNEDAVEPAGKGNKQGGKPNAKLPPIKNTSLVANGGNKLSVTRTDEEPTTSGRQNQGQGQGQIVKKSKSSMSMNSDKLRLKPSDGAIMLPGNQFRRPFVYTPDGDIMEATMDEFQKRHGLTSREYANKCLAVASKFKDKTWMSQVLQALVISRRGVKKTIVGLPHLFIDDGAATHPAIRPLSS